MAIGLARMGNKLYTGERSYPFVQKSSWWFAAAAILVIASIALPFARGGFNFGIEFTGGSEFTVSGTALEDVGIGEDVVSDITGQTATVTTVTDGTISVQTEQLDDDETLQVAAGLQEGYEVDADAVSSTYIGPVWGDYISQQMIIALIVFLVLVSIYMAVYFRTWKMSLAAITGLAFVVITSVGVYAATGFEVTPSAIIGFLTILSYALYDTMVVFDKMRENLATLEDQWDQTFRERANLAINQTLVRSINTSVVGILPVGSILFIGALLLGAGTLQDIALALFVGIIIGTLATIFIQAPLYVRIREKDRAVKAHTQEVLALRKERELGRITDSGTLLNDSGQPIPFPALPEPEAEEDPVEDMEEFHILVSENSRD